MTAEIIEAILELLKSRQPGVLVTVVRTRGSTPQKTAAKLLVTSQGKVLGTLGGGCVERDMLHFARKLLQQPTGPLFRRYHLNEELAARDGLVCGGTMEFFIEPLAPTTSFVNMIKAVETALRGGSPVALATVIQSPAAAAVGSKLLIREDGKTIGSRFERELKNQILKIAQPLMATGGSVLTGKPDGTQVYIEGYTTPPTLLLVGAGHVNKAVAELAHKVGFRIFVVDDRPEFANPQRFPEAQEIAVAPFSEWANQFSINFNTYVVVATRGHKYDDLALGAAIHTPARYVGLIGSKRKSLMIFQRLLQEGVPPEKIREIRAPIGLDIGAVTPEEIAVSIVAEIIMSCRGGKGGVMKLKPQVLARLLRGRKESPLSKE